MTPATQGRHCEACAKTVVDFTNMSDAEVLALLRDPRQSTCGRFRGSQLDRSIGAPLPVAGVLAQAVPYAMRAALAIGGLGVAVDSAQAQMGAPAILREVEVETEPQLTGEVTLAEDADDPQPVICATGADPGVVSRHDTVPRVTMGMVMPYQRIGMGGRTAVPEGPDSPKPVPAARPGFKWATGAVVDGETGEALIGVVVVVPGTKLGTVTDYDGRYALEIPEDQQLLELSYVGYETIALPYDITNGTTAVLPLGEPMGEVVIAGGYTTSPLGRIRNFFRAPGYGWTRFWDRLTAWFSPTPTDPSAVGGLYQPVETTAPAVQDRDALLYPNPSAGTATLQLRSDSDVSMVSVYDALGQLVLARPTGGQNQVEIHVPSTAAAGTYLVRGTDDSGRVIVTLPWIVNLD